MRDAEAAVRGSATWAAWGDALGFISELTDAEGLVWRTGKDRVITTTPWRRRIGGRYGVQVELPEGAYSDDTQLRLAVSRAIRSYGDFDVDAFAKVELVSWQAYALGAGRGTKAAAAGMTRVDTKWANNHFSTKDVSYRTTGGNGAAMRVQPHVWSSPDMGQDVVRLLTAVLRDSVVTHGHPRGFFGAAIHALCLARAFQTGTVPGPEIWLWCNEVVRLVPQAVRDDDELSTLWLPSWQRTAEQPFLVAVDETIAELQRLFQLAIGLEPGRSTERADAYRDLLQKIGGFDPATRGSATITAIAAAALAYWYRDDPAAGLVTAANCLGSDTDTIATMAGALVGSVVGDRPPGPVQDLELIEQEAIRLHRISQGQIADDFRYPDPLRYNPPRSALDLVGLSGDDLALSGIGVLSNLGEEWSARGSVPSVYQWATAPTGQRMLIRRRTDPKKLPPHSLAVPRVGSQPVTPPGQATADRRDRDAQLKPASGRPTRQPALPFEPPPQASNAALASDQQSGAESSLLSIEEAVELAIQNGFSPDAVGRLLLAQIRGGRYDADRAAGFAGMLAREMRRYRGAPPAPPSPH